MLTYLKKGTAGFSGVSEGSSEAQWIIAESPNKEEIQQLVSTYQLPKDYITSVLDEREMARSEGNWRDTSQLGALILIQYPTSSISPSGYMQLDTFPCSVIQTTNNQIITVTEGPCDFINEVRAQNFSHAQVSTINAILFQILWHISKHYNDFLTKIIQEIDDLEGQLKIATENNQLYQMMDIQKSLVYFESALSENIRVMGHLYDTRKEAQETEHLPHLHDILVEMKQALTTTRIQLKLVDQISSTFSAIVSNNLNIVMKILTSLTVVLTIPTIVGGIYGMNVKLPFANREDAFFWIFLITIIVCIGVIRYLKKRNLL